MAAGAGSGCLLAGSRPRRAGSGLPSWGRRRPTPGLPLPRWVWGVAMPPPPLSAPELASVAWVGVVCGRVVVVAAATCPGLPSSHAPPPVECSIYVSARLGSPTVGARLCRRSSRWWPHVLGCAATLVGGGGAVGARPSAAWLCCCACQWWVRGRGGCARSPSVGAGWRARRGVPGPLDPGREYGTGESLGLLLDQ